MKQDTLTQIMAFAHSIAHYLSTWIVALVQMILPMAKPLSTLADPKGGHRHPPRGMGADHRQDRAHGPRSLSHACGVLPVSSARGVHDPGEKPAVVGASGPSGEGVLDRRSPSGTSRPPQAASRGVPVAPRVKRPHMRVWSGLIPAAVHAEPLALRELLKPQEGHVDARVHKQDEEEVPPTHEESRPCGADEEPKGQMMSNAPDGRANERRGVLRALNSRDRIPGAPN